MNAASKAATPRTDNMTPEQRSRTMSRIRSRDTKAELQIRRMLHRKGYRYAVCRADLPGKPDLVFAKARVVVFVDGDFWHGWRPPAWIGKLQPYWRAKIEGNVKRDRRNRARLRRGGWTVVRILEHEVKQNPEQCVAKVESAIRKGAERLR